MTTGFSNLHGGIPNRNAMFKTFLFTVILSLVSATGALLSAADFGIGLDGGSGALGSSPKKLKGNDKVTTKDSYKPPVEITIEAKTDSTNLRMGYAADQVIFNWEVRRNELRVDGGPASGRHKPGAGLISVSKYVTIRWLVTPKKQTIHVDGVLRYEHEGDYSKINKPVVIFPSHGSEVIVRSIKVQRLAGGSE